MAESCRIIDGKYVSPCWGLSRQSQLGIKGGIEYVPLYDFQLRQQSRSYFVLQGVRARDIKPVVLNYCPFCGEKIDAAVANDTEAS